VARSRLPTLERGRGSSWEPRDKTRKRTYLIKLESAQNKPPQVVSSRSGTTFDVGTSHGHFRPQDSPRPGLRGCQFHPPYSILCDASHLFDGAVASFPAWGSLCDAPPHPRPNGTNSRDSQVGVPKSNQVSRFWTPRTLGGHISSPRPRIATRSKSKL